MFWYCVFYEEVMKKTNLFSEPSLETWALVMRAISAESSFGKYNASYYVLQGFSYVYLNFMYGKTEARL